MYHNGLILYTLLKICLEYWYILVFHLIIYSVRYLNVYFVYCTCIM